jgi:anti-anti-sigma factor
MSVAQGARRAAEEGEGASRADRTSVTVDLTWRSAVVRVHGPLDRCTVPEVRPGMLSVSGSGHDVLVDLAEVPAVDASGLVLLVAASRRCASQGHRFWLRNAPQELWELARRTGLARWLAVRRPPA